MHKHAHSRFEITLANINPTSLIEAECLKQEEGLGGLMDNCIHQTDSNEPFAARGKLTTAVLVTLISEVAGLGKS